MSLHLCLLGDANSVHVRRWAHEMQQRGLRVSVVTARPHALPGVEQRVLTPVVRSRDWLWRVAEARRHVRELAPDIVHAHYVTSYGYLAARSGHPRLAMTAWGSDILVTPEQHAGMRLLTRWTLRRAGLITGDSLDLVQRIEAYQPGAPVHQVHWGADMGRFRPAPWGDKPGFEVMSLRNWEANYRIAVIIDAIALLHQRQPAAGVHLHLLGGGPMESELREQVRRLGLQAQVSFHGRVADAAMAAALQACKVSVSVPASDATSVSVLESMACGLPVVATDLAANRQWLAGDEGLLVPLDDAQALCRALESLCLDDARAQRLGQANHERMQLEGGRAAQMDRMVALYREWIGRGAGPGAGEGAPAGLWPAAPDDAVSRSTTADASAAEVRASHAPGRTVSAIVPCRNELAHIDGFCANVLAQQLPPDWSLQVVVADGMSQDGTRERLAHWAQQDPRLRWLDSPGGIVSAGLNRALASAHGEVIVRLDVHTHYAPDYVAQALSTLQRTHADNVGGPWHAQAPEGAPPMQRAVAAAFQCAWVAGGALSRRLEHEGWVDTVYLGCWPRQTFERFGGFDETLVRNQDDEHNLRLVRGGGRVWQSAAIRSLYRPRAKLGQVFAQYLQYGYWKPFVMKKHRQAASWRHLVPGVFVALLLAAAAASLFSSRLEWLAALVLPYLLALAAMTWRVAVDQRPGGAAMRCVPLVIGAYHLAYGLGSLAGWFDVLSRGRGRARFSMLTR